MSIVLGVEIQHLVREQSASKVAVLIAAARARPGDTFMRQPKSQISARRTSAPRGPYSLFGVTKYMLQTAVFYRYQRI